MFIQTESTPNPATLKFLPGCAVMTRGTANFADASEAGTSPLAQKLFATEGVLGVFLGADFITVSKAPSKEWDTMKPLILGAIMEHFQSGKPVIVAEDAGAADAGDEGGIIGQIKELIDTRVRPAVAQDGGDIVFKGFEDGVVYLHMQGACSGCPSSTMTLKHGIENMLRYYVPEVQEVRAVE
ncbi:MAG: NifU family protein [Rhodospirillaceae bacterium]|jgi:Fe-S cluster biogenesis protein NfuA